MDETEYQQMMADNPDLKIDTTGQIPLARNAQKRQGGVLADELKGIYGIKDRGPSRAKYHNTPTTYNNRRYSTKGEARKAQDLDLLVKAGEIDFWLYHVRFPLPGDSVYESDFVTYKAVFYDEAESPHWNIKVIEVKGWWKATAKHPKAGFKITDTAKLKLKLFRERYPHLELSIEQ